jgi:hypothetical protein
MVLQACEPVTKIPLLKISNSYLFVLTEHVYFIHVGSPKDRAILLLTMNSDTV